MEAELGIIKTLQVAGYDVSILLDDSWRALRPYYEATGTRGVRLTSEFNGLEDVPRGLASRLLASCASLADAAELSDKGVRIGRIAASTALRALRSGNLDLNLKRDREILTTYVAKSLMAAARAERILEAVNPSLLLFWDTEYSPRGQLFDLSIARGMDVIAHSAAHRTNKLMFKRYTLANRDRQIASLSPASWSQLLQMDWTDAHAARLELEISRCYRDGDWYREAWTQKYTTELQETALRLSLELDPRKRTIAIFPHISWDAPLNWGDTLFPTYEEWLLATVRIACANDAVNWILKIHPAHQGKRPPGDRRPSAELLALERNVGALPRHIKVIPEDTEISAQSLLSIIDACVTVRGTVGIEAARAGIPVLTAASARYSGKGFTTDSKSRVEYLSRLESIQGVPRLSREGRLAADRYAYGLFVARPIAMTSVSWDYGPVGSTTRGRINVRHPDEWGRAKDVTALAEWFVRSSDEDFFDLSPVESVGP